MQSRFRDTRSMPYAYWGGECRSERAPALGERDGRHSEAKWENEGERTPSGVVYGTVEERQMCVDEQTKYPRVGAKRLQLRDKSGHLAREEWFFYSTRQFSKDIAIFAEKFRNLEPRVSNDQSEPSSTVEKREAVRSEREKKGTGQGQDGWCYSVT